MPAGHAKCLWRVGLSLSPLSQGPPGCSSIQLKPLLLGCGREEDLRVSAWGGEGRGGEGRGTAHHFLLIFGSLVNNIALTTGGGGQVQSRLLTESSK